MAVCVWNLLAPTTDPRDPALLSNVFATLPLTGPVALEFAADPERLRLLARAWDAHTGQSLTEALYAAIPQAQLLAVGPADDPARSPMAAATHGRCVELVLERSEIYSLRTYHQPTIDQAGDPLAVLVRSLQSQQPDERCLLRLTLAPAPPDWPRRYRHYQRDVTLAAGSSRAWPAGATEAIATQSSALFLGLTVVALIGVLGYRTLRAQTALIEWLLSLPPPLTIAGGVLVGAALLGLIAGLRALTMGWWEHTRLIPSQPLLATKLGATACLARIHLWCWGPTPAAVQGRIDRIVAALGQYGRADGNRLLARPARLAVTAGPVALGPRLGGLIRRAAVLSTAELCSLWGPVSGLTDVGDLTRGGAVRRRPPRYGPDGVPWLVDGGLIGLSEQGGVGRRIAFPRELRQRVTAIFGSTGSGKSTLLTALVIDALAAPTHAVVVFDSHSRLVQSLLGHVPPERTADVILIDLGDPDHSVGLNLLDVSTGRAPERIVADTIGALARLWPETWGDRMEQMLRAALTVLVDANQRLPPDQQFTIFQVLDLLLDPVFRQAVRQRYAPDQRHDLFWHTYFASRSAHLREEMINPVLTKLFKLRDLPAAQRLLGQPRSTIDLCRAVLDHRVLLIDLAQGIVGEDLAGIVGALIMASVDQAIISQARLAPAQLASGSVFFDEFETMPAINYDRIIAQLRKYGFGFFFATQSVEALATRQPILLAQLRDNCQALFAFRTSAEAGRQLAPAFDGLVTPTDLANLETGCCYAKMEARQRPIPAFWLRVHAYPPGSAERAALLTTTSRAASTHPVPTIDRLLTDQAHRLGALVAPPGTLVAPPGASSPLSASPPAQQPGVSQAGAPPDGEASATTGGPTPTRRTRRRRSGERSAASAPGDSRAETMATAQTLPAEAPVT